MTPKPPGPQGIPESVRRSIAEAEEVMASGSPMVTLDEVLTAGDAATFSFAARLVCASCAAPVERTLDDDWQHESLDDGLACAAWPVRPARAEVETDR